MLIKCFVIKENPKKYPSKQMKSLVNVLLKEKIIKKKKKSTGTYLYIFKANSDITQSIVSHDTDKLFNLSY
jgi:hypothetical protein